MKAQKSNNGFIAGRIKSFGHAFNGIPYIMKERNMWVHLFAAILIICGAFYFQFEKMEWCILILCITLIFALEGLNTAIEYLVDLVSPEHDKLAGKVKDISSAGVLFGAIGVLIIGILLFARHFS
ncbi:MAG: diacylglycerol kinase family protein [Flavobacteriales bacterium]|nr:diacylglycerol kinase family protein [Flavobacteriales bacterium]